MFASSKSCGRSFLLILVLVVCRTKASATKGEPTKAKLFLEIGEFGTRRAVQNMLGHLLCTRENVLALEPDCDAHGRTDTHEKKNKKRGCGNIFEGVVGPIS